jgi:hypothetical protein
MSDVTNIEQARELKAAGLPPNLPVITKHWSRRTSELMFKVDKAQTGFLKRVVAYSESGSDGEKYDALVRAWNKLSVAAENLHFWSEELGKTDKNEAGALRGVIEQNLVPMLDSFDAIFDQLENGEAVTFQIGINDKPTVVRGESSS